MDKNILYQTFTMLHLLTGEAQKAAVKEAFAKAGKVLPLAEPLDWIINSQPQQWKLNNKVVNFDWA